MAGQLLDTPERRRVRARKENDAAHERRSVRGPRARGIVTISERNSRREVGLHMALAYEMLGFSQGSTAVSTAPLGSGAIWLQSPTPGDQ